MKTEYSCEQCGDRLIEFACEELSVLERQLVDRHLARCTGCQSQLTELWELQRSASEWSDQRVPGWPRRELFFEPSPWPLRIQWVLSSGSFAMLVLVVLILAWQEPLDDQLQSITTRLGDLESSSEEYLAGAVAQLRQDQVSTNQLLARSLMAQRRQERREDMAELVRLMDGLQVQRQQDTENNLQYLISTQIEDRRDIEALARTVWYPQGGKQ